MQNLQAGLVGAGWMGGTLLKRLAERSDVDVLALCEPNGDRGGEALGCAGLPVSLLTGNYDDIISNPDIDAVWIASPNSAHAPQALQAMRAGKHVFCEKPCATKFSDFRALIEAERANPDLITYVDFILYFDSMESRLRQMVSDGVFGTVAQVQVNYRHPINIAGDKVWKLSKETMGDAIAMGINHALSVMIYLMRSQTGPVGVLATSRPAQIRQFEEDPIWNILVKFDNGGAGFCFGNIENSNGYDAYHNVLGSEGGFVFDSQLERTHKVRYWSARETAGKWVYPLDPDRCAREGRRDFAWPPDTTTPDSGDVVNHQTSECVGHFIECVKSGTKSPLSFTNSAILSEIGWAARMSAATGKQIPLPLDYSAAAEFFD
ncbi:MAG: Gfo/Idh/MocA family oxidoreductase [Armatimonadota bacterium]|nr:Gfo/Idh/MocA family oxidoreductase [Armatimonadota bacterium]